MGNYEVGLLSTLRRHSSWWSFVGSLLNVCFRCVWNLESRRLFSNSILWGIWKKMGVFLQIQFCDDSEIPMLSSCMKVSILSVGWCNLSHPEPFNGEDRVNRNKHHWSELLEWRTQQRIRIECFTSLRFEICEISASNKKWNTVFRKSVEFVSLENIFPTEHTVHLPGKPGIIVTLNVKFKWSLTVSF